ncbi:MAG: hypothetical protein P8165_08875 [Deltaproteobacteria bacterium]|jgi:hypothetical protein
MKKQRLISLALVFLSCIWISPVFAEETTGPKVVIENPDFDFKSVDEGTVVEHTFKVLNQGDQTLKIFSVRPG